MIVRCLGVPRELLALQIRTVIWMSERVDSNSILRRKEGYSNDVRCIYHLA